MLVDPFDALDDGLGILDEGVLPVDDSEGDVVFRAVLGDERRVGFVIRDQIVADGVDVRVEEVCMDRLLERPPVCLDDDWHVDGVGDGIDSLAGAFVCTIRGRVRDERRFEEEQRLDVRREGVDFASEEVGDGVEELGFVSVVLVSCEIRKRVGAGSDGLEVLGEAGGSLEFCGQVPVESQFALDDRIAVEVVVVVVTDDPPGLHLVVNGERVSEHVVPPRLPLDDPIEPGVFLCPNEFCADVLVDGDDCIPFVPADHIALLMTFEVRECLLCVVRQRIEPRRRRK